MDVSQRVDHLICGFFRLNYNDQHDKHFPYDIITICDKYIGITKHNEYHLIKSNTELEIEEKERLEQSIEPFSVWNSELTIVLLGSGGVGKSALFSRFTTGYFSQEYDPTILEHCRKATYIDGKPFTWDIYDSAGQYEFSYLQDKYMREANLFIFVYSITSPQTLEEVIILRDKIMRAKDGREWYGVVAGNKCDLEDQRRTTWLNVDYLAEQWSNLKFYETSAKEKINNQVIFEDCARWYIYAHDCQNKRDLDLEESKNKSCCRIW